MRFAAGCAIGCAILGVGFTAAGAALGAWEGGKEVLADTFVQQMEGVTMEWSVSEQEADFWDADWEEYSLPVEDEDYRVYEFENIKKIEADLSTDQIYFSTYEGKTIRVETDGDNEILRVKQEGDELKLKSLKKTHDCEIYVYYPETLELKEMDLEVSAGAIYLEDKLKAEELEIEVGAGELIADGEILASEINLDVGTGTAVIEKATVAKIKAECGVGTLDIGLTGTESEYRYKVECGLGSVSIGEESYEGLSETVKVDRPDAKKELQVECGLGDVTVAFEK